MPELAEVEFIRQRWNPGLGQRITGVRLHASARVLRDVPVRKLTRLLTGATLVSSEAAAKQMLFRASGHVWLGVHLGMTGDLSVQPAGHADRKADHLILDQPQQCLVFSDPRMFGRIQFAVGAQAPSWWANIAPPLLSAAFTLAAMSEFLDRRARSPLKAVLLMQERFPGVGNWMADEILWRAGIHPRRVAGSLDAAERSALYREVRWVADRALKTIGRTYADPPKTWLFPHRWQDGGRCPRTGVALVREDIGGRTTCWSPARQTLR